ncbi:TPA: 6-phosphofructokinase [Candidatus Poribacteria bacterium]|nr:6-phosphofructokinase [Candidatus Poribacteria bacterium]HEX29802.1 6-phosphofructokinase [Candidatus Poribacteria bacterium]
MRIKRIGLFTSGGDAPGMNACVRAVVRTAIYHGLEVIGILRGYAGMIKGEMIEMNLSSVSNIIQRGGTILKTARSEEFMREEGRAEAAKNLREWNIDALVAIGGDGTYRGASRLSREHGIPVVGVPGTIDNDIYGTDFTIGYDTAINTAMEAIDRIRDTAASHERIFFIEVMGRESGFIALEVGVAGGAEAILIPEVETDIDEMCRMLMRGRARGKTSSIVIVAEGNKSGGAHEVAEKVKERTGLDYRVTVLGHVQRGGSPTVRDRVLASKLGSAAVEALLKDKFNVMVGEINGQVKLTPLDMIWTHKKQVDLSLYKLAGILSI